MYMWLLAASAAYFRKDTDVPQRINRCQYLASAGKCHLNPTYMPDQCVCEDQIDRFHDAAQVAPEAARMKARERSADSHTSACSDQCSKLCSNVTGNVAAQCGWCSSAHRCWIGATDYQTAIGHRHTSFFRGARIAVLLTGQAFRAKYRFPNVPPKECDAARVDDQRRWARKLISHVVVPFEASGAHVEILLTFGSCGETKEGRALRRNLTAWYDGRVVASRVIHGTTGTRETMQLAYSLLWEHVGRTFAGGYDFVFNIRHDMEVQKPVYEWDVDWGRLLFKSGSANTMVVACIGCNKEVSWEFNDEPCSCRPMTDDKMMWVPSRFLPSILKQILHRDFEGHYLVESFVSVPEAALAWQYYQFAATMAAPPLPPPRMVWGNTLQVETHGSFGSPPPLSENCRRELYEGFHSPKIPVVPPHLQAEMHEVGFLRDCDNLVEVHRPKEAEAGLGGQAGNEH